MGGGNVSNQAVAKVKVELDLSGISAQLNALAQMLRNVSAAAARATNQPQNSAQQNAANLAQQKLAAAQQKADDAHLQTVAKINNLQAQGAAAQAVAQAKINNLIQQGAVIQATAARAAANSAQQQANQAMAALRSQQNAILSQARSMSGLLTSGNIGGLASGLLSGQLSNVFGAVNGKQRMSGAIGGLAALGSSVVGVPTGAAGIGTGLAGLLPAGLGTAVASVAGLGVALSGVATAYLNASQAGYEFTANLSRMSKEIGVAAPEVAQLNSLMAFTANPNSPFASIIFQQVQAQLENVRDVMAGLELPTPQTDNFMRAMDTLGLKVNEVKGVIDLTMKMSEKMYGLKTSSPTQYAQISQQLGGLFGKDFAAVYGTNPEYLKQMLQNAPIVTQKNLDTADMITAANAKANAAQNQWELNVSKDFSTFTVAVQDFKTAAFNLASGKGLKTNPASTAEDENRARIEANISNIEYGIANGIIAPQYVEESKRQLEEYRKELLRVDAATADLEKTTSPKLARQQGKEALDAITKLVGAQNALDAEVLKRYGDAIGYMGDMAKRAEGSFKTMGSAMGDALGSFNDRMDYAIKSYKGYDNYYDKLQEAQGKIAEIDKAAGRSVIVSGTVTEKVQDLARSYLNARNTDLIADSAVAKTPEAQQAKALRDQNRTRNLNDQRAALIASGINPDDTAYMETILDPLVLGGTLPGQAVKWGKAGMSKQMIEERKNQFEIIKELQETEMLGRFETVRAGIGGFMQTMIPTDMSQIKIFQDFMNNTSSSDAPETMKKFAEVGGEMAGVLQEMATNAGLFNSIGFARAIGESALAAKLASGGFGEGSGAIRRYWEEMKNLYNFQDTFMEQLTGKKAVSWGDVVAAGLDPVVNMAGGTDVSGAVTKRDLIKGKADAGTLTGADLLTMKYAQEGIDVANGIKGMFKDTFSGFALKANEAAMGLDKEIRTVLNREPYGITLKVDNLGELSGAIADAGKKPPPTTFNSGLGGTQSALTKYLGNLPFPRLDGESDEAYLARIQTEKSNITNGANPSWLPGASTPSAALPPGSQFNSWLAGVNDDIGKILEQIKEGQIKNFVSDDAIEASGRSAAQAREAIDAEIAKIPQQVRMIIQASVNVSYNVPTPPGAGGNLPPCGAGMVRREDGKCYPAGSGTGAIGGQMWAGQTYWVGEHGAEMFVPGANGYLMAEQYARQFNGGSRADWGAGATIYSSPVNNSISIDARGAESPYETERAVRRGATRFFSDDIRVATRDRLSRRGIR